MINDDGWVLAGKFLGLPPSLKTKRFVPLIIYYIIQLYNNIIFTKSTDKKIKITCRPESGGNTLISRRKALLSPYCRAYQNRASVFSHTIVIFIFVTMPL